MMSKIKLIKPIPIYGNINVNLLATSFKILPIAGTTLREGSFVYLCCSLPDHFLLTDFYDHTQLYNKIPIHNWNQYLIGPALFQEWILSIKSARMPHEQNIELFQSSENHVYGFRVIRDILPDEPLLAWFSLSHLRLICEKIKLSKIIKVEDLLKSTRCPCCKIDQHYLNVLVAHVLRNQCKQLDSIKSNNNHFVEDVSLSTKTFTRTINNENHITPKHHQLLKFSTNGISSYKMSILDATHTAEFTACDNKGKQRKDYLCLFCGKIYNRKYSLKIHLRMHTGYEPLRCRICFRVFSDPLDFNKHIRLHSISSSTIDILPSVLSQESSFNKPKESNINRDSQSFDDDK